MMDLVGWSIMQSSGLFLLFFLIYKILSIMLITFTRVFIYQFLKKKKFIRFRLYIWMMNLYVKRTITWCS